MREGHVDALLLAAGRASRFGGQKLLARLDGAPLAAHAARTVHALLEDGTLRHAVAMTDGSRELGQLFASHDIRVAPLADPALPLSGTLRAGLAALESECPPASAALVFLADQPRVNPDVARALLVRWRRVNRPVVRPCYQEERGVPGHPVLVARPAWHFVEALEGDQGLSAWLKDRPGLVETIPVPGRNPDVDTPDDLERA
jgi:molybdenum cofactor cytidylyltransferase